MNIPSDLKLCSTHYPKTLRTEDFIAPTNSKCFVCGSPAKHWIAATDTLLRALLRSITEPPNCVHASTINGTINPNAIYVRSCGEGCCRVLRCGVCGFEYVEEVQR